MLFTQNAGWIGRRSFCSLCSPWPLPSFRLMFLLICQEYGNCSIQHTSLRHAHTHTESRSRSEVIVKEDACVSVVPGWNRKHPWTHQEDGRCLPQLRVTWKRRSRKKMEGSGTDEKGKVQSHLTDTVSVGGCSPKVVPAGSRCNISFFRLVPCTPRNTETHTHHLRWWLKVVLMARNINWMVKKKSA